MSYSYNRIHNDYDNNVVRVELNSTYRPRTVSREPIRITSSVNRTDTFTKNDRPSNIIRSDTFILKHHENEESSDERPDYNTYTRSKKKSFSNDKKQLHDDNSKSNYSTYTRPEKKGNEIFRGMSFRRISDWPFLGNGHEKSLYINTDTYRKSSDKKPRSSLSQESENLNSNTFTKSSKPKRVESLIKRFDMSFWRRNKDKEPKEKSPSPSGSDTIKRSKNIFNTLISSGKKSTRDVGIECKMDEDRDYYAGMGTRKSSIQSLISEKKHHRPPRTSKRHEHGSNQQLTSIIKPPERRYPYYEKKSTSSVPAPIRVELGVRNSISKYDESKRRPIGIASPLPQARNRSALKSATTKSYESKQPEINAPRSYAPARVQEMNNFNREGSDRKSFREYREKLKLKNDGRRITDNSDDELRQSYQQSFFIPM